MFRYFIISDDQQIRSEAKSLPQFHKDKISFSFRFKSNVIQVKMFNKNTHTTVTICNLALPLESDRMNFTLTC